MQKEIAWLEGVNVTQQHFQLLNEKINHLANIEQKKKLFDIKVVDEFLSVKKIVVDRIHGILSCGTLIHIDSSLELDLSDFDIGDYDLHLVVPDSHEISGACNYRCSSQSKNLLVYETVNDIYDNGRKSELGFIHKQYYLTATLVNSEYGVYDQKNYLPIIRFHINHETVNILGFLNVSHMFDSTLKMIKHKLQSIYDELSLLYLKQKEHHLLGLCSSLYQLLQNSRPKPESIVMTLCYINHYLSLLNSKQASQCVYKAAKYHDLKIRWYIKEIQKILELMKNKNTSSEVVATEIDNNVWALPSLVENSNYRFDVYIVADKQNAVSDNILIDYQDKISKTKKYGLKGIDYIVEAVIEKHDGRVFTIGITTNIHLNGVNLALTTYSGDNVKMVKVA